MWDTLPPHAASQGSRRLTTENVMMLVHLFVPSLIVILVILVLTVGRCL